MINYLFEFVNEYSILCGERIFVQCNSKEEADKIIDENFWGDGLVYLGEYSDEEAEEMGYDTY